ncbi:MAG: site-specific DNA-methyltransferase [Tissierellaceae bacterium]|nr:site-specific DNA-methyltransferase [Tissierellaceae bacterium]
MIETSLKATSPDIGEENIKKLKAIFPEAMAEDKIDFEKLRQVLGEYVEDSNERYNFTWNGKGRALRLSQTPSLGTLRPCKEESKDWDTTENLYIEGDNLEVLKLLQKSYYGKVKMIYIDPPYNTGKDFVYKDDFHDSLENYKRITGQVDGNGKSVGTNTETSGRYHTDWLNMMYPRLRLARNLLTDDGVIFISIDDNEVANLRKLCDEVFGEENLINNRCFIYHIPNGTNKGFIARAHEYILGYAKYIEELASFFRTGEETISEERCTNTPTEENPTTEILFKAGLRYDGSEGIFTGIIGGKEPIEIVGTMTFENGKLKHDVILKSSWRNKSQILSFMENGIAYDEQGQEVIEIFFSKDGKPKYRKKLKFYSPKSVQQFKDYSFEKDFDVLSFENPKPVSMIEFLTSLVCEGNDIVLDFFAGSSTTANAVFKYNSDNHRHVRFILVQLNEQLDKILKTTTGRSKTFAASMIKFLNEINKPHFLTEIGKERIRKAGEIIKNELKATYDEYQQKQQSLIEDIEQSPMNPDDLDIGFKVLKLDTSNIRKWQPDYDNLEQSLLDYVENYVEGRTELDVVYEIMLKYGLDLAYPFDEFTIANKKVYSIGFGMLMICLDNEITTDIAKGILSKVKELAPETTRVVFKDNGFKTDSNKTNIKEILKSGGIEEFITL